MNGRIYDAQLGVFLSPDPNIQSPGNLQNYHRYGYVLNNPLSYTDPSGFFFKSLFMFLKKWWKVIVTIIIVAVVTYFTFGTATGWAAQLGFAAGTVGNGIVAGAITGAGEKIQVQAEA